MDDSVLRAALKSRARLSIERQKLKARILELESQNAQLQQEIATIKKNAEEQRSSSGGLPYA